MRHVLALLTLVPVTLVLGWSLLGPGGAPAPAAAHAAVLASAETTGCPAPERVVKLALAKHRAADRAFDRWQRARRCLALDSGRLRVERRPSRDAAASVWLAAMDRWQRQERDFRHRLARLVDRMRHPGGTSSGVRWLPLARWVGWPASTLSHLAYIIMRESSGRPRALNASSGCAGLLQIHPCHGVANVFDPEVNLRAGLRLYRQCGWSPWAL